FSSRRRHTRSKRDWSSDVCSSDLSPALVSQSIVGLPHLTSAAIPFGLAIGWVLTETDRCRGVVAGLLLDTLVFATITFIAFNGRSEERRVGKECRVMGAEAEWKEY